MLHGELHGGDVAMNDCEMEEVSAFGVDGVDVASVVDEHVEGFEESAGASGDDHRGPTFGVTSFFVDSRREGEVDHDRVANCRGLMQNRAVFVFRVDVGAAFDEKPQQFSDSLFFAPVDGLPAGDHQRRRFL